MRKNSIGAKEVLRQDVGGLLVGLLLCAEHVK